MTRCPPALRDLHYCPIASPQHLTVAAVEQMCLSGLWAKAQALADLRAQRRIDPRNRRRTGKIEMNQRVRAERFDELDADRNAVSRIGRHREMLGTNSEHAIAGLPQPAATLRIQRHGRTCQP